MPRATFLLMLSMFVAPVSGFSGNSSISSTLTGAAKRTFLIHEMMEVLTNADRSFNGCTIDHLPRMDGTDASFQLTQERLGKDRVTKEKVSIQLNLMPVEEANSALNEVMYERLSDRRFIRRLQYVTYLPRPEREAPSLKWELFNSMFISRPTNPFNGRNYLYINFTEDRKLQRLELRHEKTKDSFVVLKDSETNVQKESWSDHYYEAEKIILCKPDLNPDSLGTVTQR